MKYIILILVTFVSIHMTSQDFPFELGRAQKAHTNQEYPCEIGVNVKDNRPNNCTFDSDFNMFEVFHEEFDHREELPNN